MPRVEWVVIGQPNGSEKGANIIVVGCDYHPSFQQIAHVDTETGEWKEQRLEHRESAEAFYRELASRGAKLRVGMEASGHAPVRALAGGVGYRAMARGRSWANQALAAAKQAQQVAPRRLQQTCVKHFRRATPPRGRAENRSSEASRAVLNLLICWRNSVLTRSEPAIPIFKECHLRVREAPRVSLDCAMRI